MSEVINCDAAYERAHKVLDLQQAQIRVVDAYFDGDPEKTYQATKEMCQLHFDLIQSSDVRCIDYYSEYECRKASTQRDALVTACSRADAKYNQWKYLSKELSPSEVAYLQKMLMGSCIIAEELSTHLAHETVSEEQILLGKKSPFLTGDIHQVYEKLLALDSIAAMEKIEELRKQLKHPPKVVRQVFDLERNDWRVCV